jgi:hypothetical protein
MERGRRSGGTGIWREGSIGAKLSVERDDMVNQMDNNDKVNTRDGHASNVGCWYASLDSG